MEDKNLKKQYYEFMDVCERIKKDFIVANQMENILKNKLKSSISLKEKAILEDNLSKMEEGKQYYKNEMLKGKENFDKMFNDLSFSSPFEKEEALKYKEKIDILFNEIKDFFKLNINLNVKDSK